MNPIIRLFAPILVTLVPGLAPAQPLASPFSPLSFDDALEKTRGNDAILIVAAALKGLRPSDAMDQTTWRDEKVAAWFKDRGLAIRFDVNEDPRLGKGLHVFAAPTTIAYAGGVEFDRITGYRDTDSLLWWLDRVRNGERSIEAPPAEEKPTSPEALDRLLERHGQARFLAASGQPEKAATEYAAVWDQSRGSREFESVRGADLVAEVRALLAKSPEARPPFAALRDAAEGRVRADRVTRADLEDWILLNDLLGEQDTTLAWLEGTRADRRWRSLLEGVGLRVEQLLYERSRWADMLLVYPDPIAKLRKDHLLMAIEEKSAPADIRKGPPPGMTDPDLRLFRERAGRLYAALLVVAAAAAPPPGPPAPAPPPPGAPPTPPAPERAAADAFLEEALKLDNSGYMRVALVDGAVRADQGTMRHLMLLDEAERSGDLVFTKELSRQLARKVFQRR